MPPIADATVCPPQPADRVSSTALVLFALAMGGFAVGTSEFASMGLLPYYAAELGLNETQAGHAVSAYALGVVVGAPLIAVASARLSRQRLLIVLMLAYGFCNLLTALAPSYGLLLLARFAAGLPHGAYFGVAAIVGAGLVPTHKRTRAVATIMLGLTIATTIGVPLANVLGEYLSWRWAYALVAVLALTTSGLIALFAPRDAGDRSANLLSELDALRRPLVWMLLGTAAVGFGGMFAIYTYATTTLLQVTQVSPDLIPVYLVIFGLGLTVGTMVMGYAGDRWPDKAPVVIVALSIFLYAGFAFVMASMTGMAAYLFLVGCMGSLGSLIQTRLMDVAGKAQTMAAAMNHSAFNFANALGPFLAGLALSAGYGLQSSGYVGAGLSVLGLVLMVITIKMTRASLR